MLFSIFLSFEIGIPSPVDIGQLEKSQQKCRGFIHYLGNKLTFVKNFILLRFHQENFNLKKCSLHWPLAPSRWSKGIQFHFACLQSELSLKSAFFNKFIASVEHTRFVRVQDDCFLCQTKVALLRTTGKWVSSFLDRPFYLWFKTFISTFPNKCVCHSKFS